MKKSELLIWLPGQYQQWEALLDPGDQRYEPGEFFDHFHDDDEPDIETCWREWKTNSFNSYEFQHE